MSSPGNPNSSNGEGHTLNLSMLNVELTTFPDITDQIIDDVAAVAAEGADGIEPVPIHKGAFPMEKRNALEQWHKGKRFEDLTPIIDRIRDRAPERMSSLGKLLVRAESGYRKNEIGLWSATLHGEVIEALADGVGADLGIDIAVVKGATYKKGPNGIYTGEREGVYKAEYLEELAADEKARGGRLKLKMIVDSFTGARPALRKAEHPVLIDPLDAAKDDASMDMDTLTTQPNGVVLLRKAGTERVLRYDISETTGQIALLEDLYE